MRTESKFKRFQIGFLSFLAIISVAAIYGGVWIMRDSCDCPPGPMAFERTLGIILFAIPALIASVFVWRRIRKGSFLRTYEEYLAAREQAMMRYGQCTRQPISRGLRIGLTMVWVLFAIFWSGNMLRRAYWHRPMVHWTMAAMWLCLAAINIVNLNRRPLNPNPSSILPPVA